MSPETLPERPPRNLRNRLRTLWKRSLFSPYYIDRLMLYDGIAPRAARLRGRMLDVGCGDRPYERMFTGVTHYVGIEHPGPAVNVEEELRTSFARAVGIVDIWGDAATLPFPDATFDSCFCAEVLEHVPDPDEVVREVHRVLRPGGIALFTVPFAGELHATPFDFRRYTSFGIRRLLEDAGLEVDEVAPRGNFPMVAGMTLTHAINRLGSREIRRDGSVSLHPLALPVVGVLSAIVQAVTLLVSRFSRDDGYCVGYAVVARRP